MNRIYISSESPEDWQKLLASPEKHWKTGFSAKALAFCWEEAKGFPKEIQEVFKDTEFNLKITTYLLSCNGSYTNRSKQLKV